MVLVETDRVPSSTRIIDPPRSFADEYAWPVTERERSRAVRADRLIDARIGVVSDALIQAVAPSPAAVAERARIARAHATASTLAVIDRGLLDGYRIDGPTAESGAAMVAFAAQDAPREVRRALRQSVVRGARARLRDERVPGSVWYRECWRPSRCGGAGIIEGMVGWSAATLRRCESVGTPTHSRRFLHFKNWWR